MKFSIRDLLLVTVIVALVLGWGLDHWRQATRIEEQTTRIEEQTTRIEDLDSMLDQAFPPLVRGGNRFPLPIGDY